MQSRLYQVVFVAMILTIISSCGGNGPGNSADAPPVRISASQIVFQQTGIQPVSLAGVVDPNIRVLAQNVSVDTASNGLTSTNLQEALDKELAVSLAKTLTGRTWNITNKTGDSTYAGTTGVVTFNDDGTMSLSSGFFAAIGKVNGNESSMCAIPQSIHYEIITDGVVYVSSVVKARTTGTTINEDAVLKIVSKSSDRIVLTGAGGCGTLGSERISILTPLDTKTANNAKGTTKSRRPL